MKITADEKRTAFSMIAAGRTNNQIVEEIGISLSSVKLLKRAYKANPDIVTEYENAEPEASEVKLNLIKRKRYQPQGEFCEEWNRTTCSILGIVDTPERFAEQWTEAVNRIRRFFGLKELSACKEEIHEEDIGDV